MPDEKPLPKREPGKAAEKVDQDAADAGAQPRKDAQTKRNNGK